MPAEGKKKGNSWHFRVQILEFPLSSQPMALGCFMNTPLSLHPYHDENNEDTFLLLQPLPSSFTLKNKMWYICLIGAVFLDELVNHTNSDMDETTRPRPLENRISLHLSPYKCKLFDHYGNTYTHWHMTAAI